MRFMTFRFDDYTRGLSQPARPDVFSKKADWSNIEVYIKEKIGFAFL